MVPLRPRLAGPTILSPGLGQPPWRSRPQSGPRLVWLVLCVSWSSFAASEADTNSLLTAWLSTQTNIQTWSAEVIQTRTLKTLTQPLTSTGHVWFIAPNRFRWELGSPPQTIAVRLPDQLLVIYPRLRRVEKYPLTGNRTGPWRDTLALLEAGFPRSRAELESRFRLLSQAITNGVAEIVLQPKSASVRRLTPQIKVTLATNDFKLETTELHFADGSILRNDFTNALCNPAVDDALLRPVIPDGFVITEPAASK